MTQENMDKDVLVEGMKALQDTLGPIEAARFFQQFNMGTGDYTKEKYESEGMDDEEILAKLREHRDSLKI